MIVSPADLRLVENLRARSPGAVELAALASLAITIEPELLRELRLTLLPHRGVASEVDLWLSSLVEARSRDGIVLQPAVAHVLRDELREGALRTSAATAWTIIARRHVALSPAIAHEERLAWLAVQEDAGEIEHALRDALRTMVEQPDRNLPAWWMRARDRLPDEVRTSEAAASLDRRVAQAATSLTDDANMQSAHTTDPDRILYVRRGHASLELGYFVPDESTVGIRVPAMEPTRVEIEWVGTDEHPSLVAIPTSGSTIVTSLSQSVRLKNERGDLYEVDIAVAPATEPEILLLGELFGAIGAGVRSAAPAAVDHDPAEVRRWVEDYVDPPWKRGLRALGPELGVSPNAPFSEFARVALDAAMADVATTRSSLPSATRSLIDRLPAFDDWDPAGALGAPRGWRSTADQARKLTLTFEPAIPQGHRLHRVARWIEAQVNPSWRGRDKRSLPDQIGDRTRFPEAVDGDVLSEPMSIQAVEHLRRQRPDLDVDVRVDGDRFRIECDGRMACGLATWLGSTLGDAIRQLIVQRSRRDARTVTVGPANADYERISDAVDGAGDGGTIVLAAGMYEEHVRLRRGQRLFGPEPSAGGSADGGEAIIDGGGSGAVVRAADDCLLRNLTIRNGGGTSGVEDCGVMIERCTGVVLQSCHIVENGHYGVILRRCDAVIEHNTIRANAVLAIYVDENVRVDIRFNLILDHRHSALDVEQPVDGSFTNNTVIRCGSPIYHGSVGTKTSLVIARNIFVGNEEAITAPAGTFGTIEHNLFFENVHNHWDWNVDREIELGPTNIVADPRFVDAAAGDYRLARESPARGAASDGTDLGALPAMEPSVFISHAPADREYVSRLARHLADAGIHAVRVDDAELADVAGGSNGASAVIAVMTPDSEASDFVRRELDRALTSGTPIFPLLLRGRPLSRLRELQYEDVSNGDMPSPGLIDDIRAALTRREHPQISEEPQTADPVDDPTRVLLMGSAPFVDRDTLRQHVRQMLREDPDAPRVLVVNGPPGSGKSYTWRFIQLVATSSSHLAQLVDVELLEPEELIQEMSRVLGLDPPERELPSATDVRSFGGLAVTRVGRPSWLVLDGIDRAATRPVVARLVEQLIDAVTSAPTQLRLVLLGYAGSISPQSTSSVLVERLGVPDQTDILNWLSGFIEQARGERDDELVDRLIAQIAPGLPEASGSMSELFTQLVGVIKQLR